MFNEAIHLKIIKKEGCYPFGKRQFMIPGSNNTKKAFDLTIIERIYYYECNPKRRSMQKARAFWFFMYFGQGMNPKDICLLQYKNITGEFLEFERAKTEDSFQEAPPRISVFLKPETTKSMWCHATLKDGKDIIFGRLIPIAIQLESFKRKETGGNTMAQ